MKKKILVLYIVGMFLSVGIPSITADTQAPLAAEATLYISRNPEIVDNSNGKVIQGGTYLEGEWKCERNIYYNNVPEPWSIDGTCYLLIEYNNIVFYSHTENFYYDGDPPDVHDSVVKNLPLAFYNAHIEIEIDIDVYYDDIYDYSIDFDYELTKDCSQSANCTFSCQVYQK
jgi:hypothetical protein